MMLSDLLDILSIYVINYGISFYYLFIKVRVSNLFLFPVRAFSLDETKERLLHLINGDLLTVQ
jgi:hypothetical protein